MFQLSVEDVIQKIQEKEKISAEDIERRIKDKQDKLSGLVSREGAAHIVANELGVRLFDEKAPGKLKIKNIVSGMRNVDLVGKVTRVFEAREFNTNNRQGKVGSFIMGDETGSVRIVLWNDQADKLRDIKDGQIVKITGGYVRERNNFKEVQLNDRSELTINPLGEKIGDVAETRLPEAERSLIKDLGESQNAEIIGTVIQLFDIRFFEICPECGRRAKPNAQGVFSCEAHNAVIPGYSYVLNAFVDDGTGNIRVACFGRQVQQMLNRTHNEILAFRESAELFQKERDKALGNIFLFSGRVSKNEMFNNVEMVARDVSIPDVEKEIQRLK
ncbi:hypothetical protein J4475_01140 [Candidatus Woesearchaeota archaeon]|nr:hypothetical protein [Candidatus Woesearchaeota archaeon]